MILLHRQREAGALMGAGSPEVVEEAAEEVAAEVVVVVVEVVVLLDTPPPGVGRELLSPPPPPPPPPILGTEGVVVFFSSPCGGAESEGVEFVGSCGRVGVDALDCKSALTIKARDYKGTS